jgi:hypothetical protein
MKAITVRDKNGILICFGPASSGYDPGVPLNATKVIEDSYETIVTEWNALHANDVLPKSLEQQVAELQIQVATLNTSMTTLNLASGAPSVG